MKDGKIYRLCSKWDGGPFMAESTSSQ
jgi:hypothetical protein